MRLVRHRPAPPLDRLIEHFWWSWREAPQAASERMLPTGTASLVFWLGDGALSCRPEDRAGEPLFWSRGLLHGPQTGYYASGPKPPGVAVGVAFRPGAVSAVMGVPASEIADRHVPLDCLWGSRADALHERMRAATRPSQVFAILERELAAWLRPPLLMHPAVAYGLARRPADESRLRIADVRREVDYSARHFIALFRSAVGLTPSQYYRIRRFSGVLRSLAGREAPDLADLAASLGYADQPHLNREFKEFSEI